MSSILSSLYPNLTCALNRKRTLLLPIGTLFGLAAQYALKMASSDQWLTGVVLYLLGGLLVAVVGWKTIAASRSVGAWSGSVGSRAAVRWRYVIAGIGLSSITFLVVGGNSISVLDTLLWVSSVGCICAGFWENRDTSISSWCRRKTTGLGARNLALMVGVVLAGAWFRMYELDELPGEMTSDHVEKLLDVVKVVEGDRPIFLENNGGREVMQVYATSLAAGFFATPPSHSTLKAVMAIAGIVTIPIVYVLGVRLSGEGGVGVLAALVFAVGWWPVVISRNGLRFPLAPMFGALTIYLIVRGIMGRSINSCVLGGVILGIGMYGYTAFRIMPLVIMLLFGLYLTHHKAKRVQELVVRQVTAVVLIGAVAAIPMLRYAVDKPLVFWSRTATRMAQTEVAYKGNMTGLLLQNTWDSVRMFAWTSDTAWLVSPTGQPALDWVTGGLFHMGIMGCAACYWKRRYWVDLFLLIAIPIMLLPSMLSLAFPIENPSLTRSSTAQALVFIVAASSVSINMGWVKRVVRGQMGVVVAVMCVVLIMTPMIRNNHHIVFHSYSEQYRTSAENASEVGYVVKQFVENGGSWETAWVFPFKHWIDTRAVGIYAGNLDWDNVIGGDSEFELDLTRGLDGMKLFVVNQYDHDAQELLLRAYPEGVMSVRESGISSDFDFIVFTITEEEQT